MKSLLPFVIAGLVLATPGTDIVATESAPAPYTDKSAEEVFRHLADQLESTEAPDQEIAWLDARNSGLLTLHGLLTIEDDARTLDEIAGGSRNYRAWKLAAGTL